MASSLPARAEVDYPSAAGRPLAESDYQPTPLTYAVERLRQYFRHRDKVYVSGDLLIYYEEGNPAAVVAPDVFVVIGADSGDRFSYRLWEEPKGPDFVLEITSRTTYREDRGKKRELYRSLGVREYWQYDPTGDYLEPPLQGAELIAGEYRLAETDAAEERERQARQRAEQARQEAETRLAQEAVARQAAEARVAELEILLRQARGGDTGQTG